MIDRYTPVVTWGKSASLGVAAAVAAERVTAAPVRGPGALILAWFRRQAS